MVRRVALPKLWLVGGPVGVMPKLGDDGWHRGDVVVLTLADDGSVSWSAHAEAVPCETCGSVLVDGETCEGCG